MSEIKITTVKARSDTVGEMKEETSTISKVWDLIEEEPTLFDEDLLATEEVELEDTITVLEVEGSPGIEDELEEEEEQEQDDGDDGDDGDDEIR